MPTKRTYIVAPNMRIGVRYVEEHYDEIASEDEKRYKPERYVITFDTAFHKLRGMQNAKIIVADPAGTYIPHARRAEIFEILRYLEAVHAVEVIDAY